ncbi:MAG: 30S ribosomal protein S5 [Candidatus Levybacteria bacterium]|nr:30S ribosomal protein S5 [Candidatus Levybacteria bacterium]
MNTANFQESRSEFSEHVIAINRISKKTKGGNKIGFSALAVVGDRKGKVGVGLGKAPDVSSAIRKAIVIGKKHMVSVPISSSGTIPFRVDIKLGAARVMLKPAPPGSGIIAGGAVRNVVAAAGIQNISSKVLGTRNKISNVYATLEALRRLAQLRENKAVLNEDVKQGK